MIIIFFLISVAFLIGIGYFLYARYLENRVVGASESNPVPSTTQKDSIDYHPANKFVLFGHHFSSIAGAGPIVGPTLAIGLFGWGGPWIWVLIGAVFFGAVHDYLSMMVSVRNNGRGIFDISKDMLGSFASLVMAIFVLLALIIIVAVFAIFTATTFANEPRIVLPSVILLILAPIFGYLVYKKKYNLVISTIISLIIFSISLFLSFHYNIRIVTNQDIWILILLAYSYFASVLPVNFLLQPRDYLSSYLLVFGIVVGIISIFVSGIILNPEIKHLFFGISSLAVDGETGITDPFWPVLFITVACGAISGFHSLVASGTSSKQLANEKDGKFVGYGAMIVEGILAILVIASIIFFLTIRELIDYLSQGRAVEAFAIGYGRLTDLLLMGTGSAFAMVMLNTFVLTTLDTATRISRFILSEILVSFFKKNISRYILTFIVLIPAGYLALSGAYFSLWKLFGTANQLVAALALTVISIYLVRKNKNFLVAGVPAIFMLATTLGSLVFHLYKYILMEDIILALIDVILLAVALIAILDTIKVLSSKNISTKINN